MPLREECIPLIKGMLDRGDDEREVAEFFELNGTELNEARRSPLAPAADLPPQTPYVEKPNLDPNGGLAEFWRFMNKRKKSA